MSSQADKIAPEEQAKLLGYLLRLNRLAQEHGSVSAEFNAYSEKLGAKYGRTDWEMNIDAESGAITRAPKNPPPVPKQRRGRKA